MNDPLEHIEMCCSRHRCTRRVVACIVFVEPGLNDRVGLRIEPTCRKHLKLHEDTARRVRHPDHPGVYRHRPNMAKILDWIHADPERCNLDSVSVRSSDD